LFFAQLLQEDADLSFFMHDIASLPLEQDILFLLAQQESACFASAVLRRAQLIPSLSLASGDPIFSQHEALAFSAGTGLLWFAV